LYWHATCQELDPPEDWGAAISVGCPGAVALLGKTVGLQELTGLYPKLGFFTAPSLGIPALAQNPPTTYSGADLAALGIVGTDLDDESNMRISPLQLSLAIASLSNQGILHAPKLIMVDTLRLAVPYC
jgi:hypothetical protein